MGRYDPKAVAESIAHTNFRLDESAYYLFSTHRSSYVDVLSVLGEVHDEYVEVIVDERELSVIVSERLYKDHFAPRECVLGPLVRIYCDVDDRYPTCTGYLLELLNHVSKDGISVYVQGAFRTDHIFVAKEDIEKCTMSLERVKLQSRELLAQTK